MVRDGLYYAGVSVLAGILVWRWWGAAPAVPLWIFAGFCLYFFRDPEREIPQGPYAVSPADGKVLTVAEEAGGVKRLSIFLNIFDVHVNRAPIGGVIAEVKYRRGKFLVASKEEASVENEQNSVTIRQGATEVTFKQIAGLIARRIVFWKQVGDEVQAGERVGLIKFGSRVDVFLGPEWEVVVRPGERVKAGSSVLARRI